MVVSVKKAGSTETAVPIKEAPSELKAIMAQITKQKGEHKIMSGSKVPRVQRLPTGVFEFDLSTGGGFPQSRYSIVYGPESSGKSNICYAAAAQAQRRPPPCNKVVWVDLEGTFDPAWAALFGIDTEELLIVRPSYGEEAVDLVDALIRAADVAFLVVDSLAVMTSTKELEQSAEKFDVGTSSILVKRMCNKIINALSTEETRGHHPAVVLINQTRFKIGVMFGDPETMPGGMTMKFLSSLTVRLYGKNVIDKNVNPDMPIFKNTTAVIKKAKVPVTKYNFEYNLCTYPHGNLSVGESDSWGMVKGHLQAMGVLKQSDKGKGWDLLGKNYPTQVYIQDTYQAEPSFALQLQELIIADAVKNGFTVEGSGAAK
jgi:recombination protein RecA